MGFDFGFLAADFGLSSANTRLILEKIASSSVLLN
jgi:hypothetical protein